MFALFVVFFFVSFAGQSIVLAFPDGAPSAACNLLKPVHGHAEWRSPSNATAKESEPFRFEVDDFYCPGAPLLVKFVANLPFKGFFSLGLEYIQTAPGRDFQRRPFGTWTYFDERLFHGLSCGAPKSDAKEYYFPAITHNSRQLKPPGVYLFGWVPFAIDSVYTQWVQMSAIVVTDFQHYYPITTTPIMIESCELWEKPPALLSFTAFKKMDLYCDGSAYRTLSAKSFAACGALCLDDCRCAAFAYSNDNEQCFLRSKVCQKFVWRNSKIFTLFVKKNITSTPWDCYNGGLRSAADSETCYCDEAIATGDYCEKSVLPPTTAMSNFCANNGTVLNWVDELTSANDSAIIEIINGTAKLCNCSSSLQYGRRCEFIAVDRAYSGETMVCYFGKLNWNRQDSTWFCDCLPDYTGFNCERLSADVVQAANAVELNCFHGGFVATYDITMENDTSPLNESTLFCACLTGFRGKYCEIIDYREGLVREPVLPTPRLLFTTSTEEPPTTTTTSAILSTTKGLAVTTSTITMSTTPTIEDIYCRVQRKILWIERNRANVVPRLYWPLPPPFWKQRLFVCPNKCRLLGYCN